jgi:hypothetical protein
MEHIKSFQSFITYMLEVQTKKIEEDKATKQANYGEFFTNKLQEYGVSTPIELPKDKRTKFYNEINAWNCKVSEAVNEADVTDKEGFKKYIYALYKKAFADDFDETKADDVVNGLIKKYKTDWGAMIGAAQSSLGESVIEGSINLNLSLNEAELTKLQKEYKEYFSALLSEFNVKSQGELTEEKRKEFFNKVKSGWVKGKGKKS